MMPDSLTPSFADSFTDSFTWRCRDRVFRVHPLSLACCALEVDAARPDPGATDPIGAPAAGTDAVNVLVVAGTVTQVLAPAVAAAYAALPEPRRVIAYGACASTGGPYWDSYSVRNGLDNPVGGVEPLVPVDVVVPGCPPRPETLAGALRLLADQMDGRS